MFDASHIPEALKRERRWLNWRSEERGGKLTKVPLDPETGRIADATDPALWRDFETAVERSRQRGHGLGFAIDGSGLVGADLDDCLDKSGRLNDGAAAIVQRLDSYTEITPSGQGLRVWVRGALPPGRRRKGPIELYDSGRYFTVTGWRLDGYPATIAERTAELAELHAELFPPTPARPATPRPAPEPLDLSDRELLDRMFRSANGAEIRALFEEGASARHASGSEADLALCNHLAFWTGHDPVAIDRLFRQSVLCDAKWLDRPDYRERTIAKAIEGTPARDPHYRRSAQTATPAVPPPNEPPGGGGGNGELAGARAPGPDEAFDDPHRLARIFLQRHGSHPDGLTLRYWSEEWHRWDGRAWRTVSDREIAAELTGAIKAEFDRVAAGGDRTKPVTTKAVANVLQALRHLALLPTWVCPRQPTWIDREPGEDFPDPREVLAASNTLVHLPSALETGSGEIPATPRYFSPNALDYPYLDPAGAGEPVEWLGFLDALWDDDRESIDCLQEWLGYLLTPDTSQQKILMFIGPSRSGKGTIARVIRGLVGSANIAAPTLSGLAMPFGLQPLIGKTVALVADARLSGRADSQIIVERLLSISGEDAQTIDRKHISSWSGELTSRFVLISNELPRLGDSSGSLTNRMILLRMTRSFLGREDTTLTRRLLAERPAILRWAIAGWGRLRDRGYFLQPESGRELLEDLNELSSPIATFIAERCEVGPDCSVPIKDLYEAWREWCKEHGRDRPGDVAGFGRSLRAFLPQLKTTQPRTNQGRVRAYQGIDLRPTF